MRQAGVLARGAVAAIAFVSLGLPAHAQLVPHRAVYDLKLDTATDNGPIAAFSGRMVIDVVAADCDGYATNSRYVFQSSNASGATLLTDLRTAQWESVDGSTFRFVVRRYDNATLTEETDGEAQRADAGMDISLKVPEERQVRYERDVLFPTQHLNRLIDAARASERTLAATIYEGTDPGDQLYDTFAVIGKRTSAALPGGDTYPGGDVLADLERWPVTVSYFPGEGGNPEDSDAAGEETPVYVIRSELFENGVSRNLHLDYGDFALKGDLTEITFLSQPECD